VDGGREVGEGGGGEGGGKRRKGRKEEGGSFSQLYTILEMMWFVTKTTAQVVDHTITIVGSREGPGEGHPPFNKSM
jgi:hypothetical protein